MSNNSFGNNHDPYADLRDLPGVTVYAPGEETVVIDGEAVDLHFGWTVPFRVNRP